MFVPDFEVGKLPAKEIKEYQEKELAKVLKYTSINSLYYKDLFQKHKINISKIKTIEDLKNIPCTTKEDLQTRNMDFLCVSKDEVVDYITTSGTLGNPVTFAATEKDLQRLAFNEYLSFVCANGTPADIYHLMITIDRRFMAGLAYFLGLRRLGAGIVRVGPGNPELQFDTIKRISPTYIITIPSFILTLIEYAEENNIDFKNTSVKAAVCIGEPLRDNNFKLNKLGQNIKSKWDIQLYSTYASTEMGAAFTECKHGVGGHHHPEMLIAEFLDEDNNHVKEGELGEVTITNLGVEGMPLIRFRTGDICTYYTEPCKCGRNSLRIGPVVGRKNQMIKYKGTTLFPSALFEILNEIPDVKNYIVEVSTNNVENDDIIVKIGSNVSGDLFKKTIKDHFRAKLRVAPEIHFSTPKEIQKLQFPESSRKPITFIDKRNK
ncbi:MAG: AMP-binding protein [Bacteroidales bacterium]